MDHSARVYKERDVVSGVCIAPINGETFTAMMLPIVSFACASSIAMNPMCSQYSVLWSGVNIFNDEIVLANKAVSGEEGSCPN